MDTKLTLRLKEEVIIRAKEYAQKHKISLSRMVETYLDSITRDSQEFDKPTPLVKSLSGVITLPDNYDDKGEYHSYLDKKYE